jgi:hypothetical protein
MRLSARPSPAAYVLSVSVAAVACAGSPASQSSGPAVADAAADGVAAASGDSSADGVAVASGDSSADAGGCTAAPVAHGSRALGMDILDVNPGGAFSDNVARLTTARGSYLTLHLPWTAIETTSGSGTQSGTLVDPGAPPALAGFDGLAASSGVKVSLTIRPVDATGKTVPADLASLDFGSATAIQRFENVLDFVLSKIAPAHLVNLMVGNEVDNFDPGADHNFWVGYAQFLAAVRAYVDAKYPGLPVGFTATLAGWTVPGQQTRDGWPTGQVLTTWASHVDAAGVTYYPLNADFTMKSPAVVAGDFAALLAAVPAPLPVHLQEVGYATSSTCASSEAAQAQFLCEVFAAWDAHADRIPRLALLRLDDVTQAQALTLAGPYGTTAMTFTEYLRTLGLYQVTGQPKAGYQTLVTEASRRGF